MQLAIGQKPDRITTRLGRAQDVLAGISKLAAVWLATEAAKVCLPGFWRPFFLGRRILSHVEFGSLGRQRVVPGKYLLDQFADMELGLQWMGGGRNR